MQEAKAKFSELIKNVVNKEPQLISVRGKPTVVVISFDKYKNLMSNKISFIELMRNSPLVGLEIDIDRKIDKEREINL
jgi:prevent-host-death family protein